MEKTTLKKLTKLIQLIGIIIFIYILIDVGIYNIASAFLKINILYLIIAFVLLIPRFSIYAYSWNYLCKKQKMNPGYFFIFKAHLVGFFYMNIVPGGIGGYIRIFYLRKKTKAPLEKCLTNSLIDYSLLYLSGLYFAFIGSIYLFDKAPEFFPILLIVLIFNTAIFVIFLRKQVGSKLFNFVIKRFIPKKFKDRIIPSIDAFYENIPRLRDFIVPIISNTLIRIITGTGVFIIAQSFSINVPYIDFIFINIIAVIIIGILPISIGGIGIREGVYVYLLGTYGVPPDVAFTISFSGYLVKMLVPSVIGLLLSFKKEFRLDKVLLKEMK